jgi:hypothetical protein
MTYFISFYRLKIIELNTTEQLYLFQSDIHFSRQSDVLWKIDIGRWAEPRGERMIGPSN